MRIEPCDYEDLPAELVKQARKEGADLDQSLISPWKIFRATWGLETVGFVGVLCRTPSVVTIRGWWVKPKFRGQGIGTALLEAATTYALDIGASKIELRTTKDRIAHRLGFQWTGYERKAGKRERHYIRHPH